MALHCVLRSLALVALSGCAAAALGQTHDVPPELWDRPRTGAAILAQQGVKSAVTAALAQRGAQLVIHHGAGQEPLLQAEELRSWLGALAIDPQRIVLRGDLAAGSAMKIEIVQ